MVICYDILKLLLVFYEEHNGKSSVFLCISQINLVFLSYNPLGGIIRCFRENGMTLGWLLQSKR